MKSKETIAVEKNDPDEKVKNNGNSFMKLKETIDAASRTKSNQLQSELVETADAKARDWATHVLEPMTVR